MSKQTPQATIPGEQAAGTEEDLAKPSVEMTAEAMRALAETQAVPEEMPPQMEMAAAEAAGVWYSGKKITGLWSINQNRNSWAAVEGIGWKKLADNSDSAVVALTMLAAHARQAARSANLREESGQIREMYVW